MTRLPNIQEIKKITMHPQAACKCVLGGDWYTINFDIEFIPGEWYPDYMEVQDFVQQHIDGESLNIEDAVAILRDSFIDFDPCQVTVTAKIANAKTHFNVEVEG